MIKKKHLLKRIACITSAVVVTLSATLCVGNLAERVTASAYNTITSNGRRTEFGVGTDYIIKFIQGTAFSAQYAGDPQTLEENLPHGNLFGMMVIMDDFGESWSTCVQLTNQTSLFTNLNNASTMLVRYDSSTERLILDYSYLFYWNGLYPYFTDSNQDVTITLTFYMPETGSQENNWYQFYYNGSTPFSIHTDLANTYYNNYYDAIYNDGFDEGEASGIQEGYQEGYDVGYNEGFDEGEESGYNLGYENGERVGYNLGLSAGYEQATEEGDFSWNSFFSAFIDVPINAFTSLLNFEILGVNLAGFFGGLLTVCLIIVIMKFIL